MRKNSGALRLRIPISALPVSRTELKNVCPEDIVAGFQAFVNENWINNYENTSLTRSKKVFFFSY